MCVTINNIYTTLLSSVHKKIMIYELKLSYFRVVGLSPFSLEANTNNNYSKIKNKASQHVVSVLIENFMKK